LWDTIAGALSGVYTAVTNWFTQTFLKFVQGWPGTITNTLGSIWSTITDALSTVYSTVSTWWNKDFIGFISGWPGTVTKYLGKLWDTVSGGIGTAFDTATSTFNGFIKTISGWPGQITSAAAGLFDGIANAFVSAVNYIIRGWNSLSFSLPSIDTHIPGVGKIGGGSFGVPQIPQIPYLAQGGLMTADGLIFAHAGEVITPAPASARGPAVNVENLNLTSGLDVETFMRKAAWVARTERV
jgi:hypothetical protein